MDYFTSRFIFLNLFRTLFWTLLGLIRSIVTLEVYLSSAFGALDSIERFTSGAMLRLSVLTFWVASSWASLDDVPRRKRERARDPKLFGGTVRLRCVDET
jgi:sulfite exporter TauE/SafE